MTAACFVFVGSCSSNDDSGGSSGDVGDRAHDGARERAHVSVALLGLLLDGAQHDALERMRDRCARRERDRVGELALEHLHRRAVVERRVADEHLEITTPVA